MYIMNDYSENFGVGIFYAHILKKHWWLLTCKKLLSSHTIINISEDTTTNITDKKEK